MTTALDRTVPPKIFAAIEKYGVDATFTAETKVYSKTTQQVTSTPTTYVRKVSPPEVNKTWRDGEVLRIARATVSVAGQGLAFTPVPGMKVSVGGTDYVITSAIEQRSGDLIAAWELRLD